MARDSARPTSLGVGSALRRARQIRGVPLETAARDTRLPLDRLQALEHEDFDLLPGEVHVRASLRTYAAYLGLDADKVLRAYGRHADEPEPPRPPAKMGAVERAMAAARIRDSQRFFLVLAGIVLASLVAVGLVSRDSAPTVAELESETPAASADPSEAESFTLVLLALKDVEVEAVSDGETERLTLEDGESKSFSAVDLIALAVSDGSAVRLELAGRDLGVPGTSGEPWSGSYTAVAAREAARAGQEAASTSPAPSQATGDEGASG